MATIYRFIVENRTSGTNDGRKVSEGYRGASKGGKWTSIFAGEKGGVEHNRKMRAINPLLNKITGGWWEKGMRIGRAGAGLVQTRIDESGKTHFRFAPTAVAIIIAFTLQQLMRWQEHERIRGVKANTQNYKALENGESAIHSEYEVSANFLNGRLTYNQNK